MENNSTEYGISRQPHSECNSIYDITMIDTKKILWQNDCLLMQKHYGKENLTLCAKEVVIGNATMSRIKEQRISVGLDNIESLAKLLKVQPYELLMQGMQQTANHIEHVLQKTNDDPVIADLAELPPLEAELFKIDIKAAVDKQ